MKKELWIESVRTCLLLWMTFTDLLITRRRSHPEEFSALWLNDETSFDCAERIFVEGWYWCHELHSYKLPESQSEILYLLSGAFVVRSGDKMHIYAACSQYPLLSPVIAFNYCDVLEAVCHCKSELKGPLETKLVTCSQSFQHIEAY